MREYTLQVPSPLATRIPNLLPKAKTETVSRPDVLLTVDIHLNNFTRNMNFLKECLALVSLEAEQDVLIRQTFQKAISDSILLQLLH